MADFPAVLPAPSSRTYSPGDYPQVEFEAQNGVKTVIRYGKNRTGSLLTLTYNNISDDLAGHIIANYVAVMSVYDYVDFEDSKAMEGIEDTAAGSGFALRKYMKESPEFSAQKWRYDGPPEVTSVVPGRSNVQCKFVACLDSP
tara:strand:- start:3475 stop:3903 length:429 start_codon:yes stop_codon:yes gene_type:complete